MNSQQTPSGPRPHDSALLKIINWHKLFDSDSPPRLGMEVRKRLPYTTFSAFTVGMAIGSSHGSKKASYKFRAENAHRFPTTSSGWFQYHKTKNYTSIVGGVKEGTKMGLKLGTGALAFSLFEEAVDYARHDQRDFLSTVTAGLSFSGIYSLLARHDVYTAARTTKLGLKLSLAYGLMQDGLESLKGNRPAYIDFLLGNRRSGVQDGGSV
ncbi:hypothetical protein ASPWEDRAFT_111310 [Aspergillus wentii DTO 134E9]|uniref:Mitochondrial import inner membrane translocase subunit TIM23 n=1 Tax=Aspergillus wentii DTO 134E9 TaxID=1073089 RepID=A0A1L9RKJ8_ASPWE|nr:uncharacterized protein ASPWEDRAFT_111310 [Aspergillus wentii DTO 134E9]KAI9924781.1 hypothetical protein MW887_006637 [Aspergillus wentii]OJJ35452.1 hypothetical protein ASPWEDRAFT_111310 [Aspergillus wentii DTO 134E9]